MTTQLLPPCGLTPHPAGPGPLERLLRRARRHSLWLALAALAAVGIYAGTASAAPLRITSYPAGSVSGSGQSLAPYGKTLYFVFRMPSFNHPIEIRDVELQPRAGIGQFDPPGAFLISLYSTSWNGVSPTDVMTGDRWDLNQIVLQKAGLAGLVIAVRTPEGCHDAAVMLRVLDLSDGRVHTIDPGWEIALDTGVSRGHGLGGCG